MIIIRWFNAFRRVDNAWRSLLWELQPHGERAAEWEDGYTRFRVSIFPHAHRNPNFSRYIKDAKKAGIFVRTCGSAAPQHFRADYDSKYSCEYYHSYSAAIEQTDWIPYISESNPAAVITVEKSHGAFNVKSEIGFLYKESSVTKKFQSDVWSEYRPGTDRLVARDLRNESDHTECWVTGVPCGLIVRAPHGTWWKSVEKKVRTLAAMRKLPLYELRQSNTGPYLFRLN